MSAHPPKYFKQTQIHCGKKLKWTDCGHRAGVGCPDCLGAGGWWEPCEVCNNYQPYTPKELLRSRKRNKK